MGLAREKMMKWRRFHTMFTHVKEQTVAYCKEQGVNYKLTGSKGDWNIDVFVDEAGYRSVLNAFMNGAIVESRK